MEVRGRQLRVAVVGAGAAGLCAARHLAARPEAFAPPVVFEASAQLGGTWVYSEERPFGKGPPLPCNMYRDLRYLPRGGVGGARVGGDGWCSTDSSSAPLCGRTNLPKEAMAFPDFPFEVALPSFLPRAAVLSYLERYTESHGLRGYIRVRGRSGRAQQGSWGADALPRDGQGQQ